ncbi:MoxR family ATPase [Fulvivirga sp.]|jgi:MoxR-like ATPase|uniref:AAA family ATPase n=1 Tax=Fulvivirga sp. TaxID=1931237 RepID=UPI0032EB1879
MENEFESRIDLTELHNSVNAIKAEIGKVIIGQERMIELLITAILADGHVLIEGVPGVAKTLTAKLLSGVIDSDFSRIQFTPDLMPSDILGTSVFNMKSTDFELKKGPIFSNIVLIDEINRSPAKTQAALFEVMEERQVTIGGETNKMEEPYLVIATQNPIEQEGTYRLPEAQLDRFIFKISVDYPTYEQEVEILVGHNTRENKSELAAIDKVLSKEQIIAYRQKVSQVHVEKNLLEYIAKIVNNSRSDHSLYLGASPRASVAILKTSKAFAAINGRDFVTPEDIKQMATPVMRHRVILTPEKEMEGVHPDQVIESLINNIEIPR